jgi:hypothetical protein
MIGNIIVNRQAVGCNVYILVVLIGIGPGPNVYHNI